MNVITERPLGQENNVVIIYRTLNRHRCAGRVY